MVIDFKLFEKYGIFFSSLHIVPFFKWNYESKEYLKFNLNEKFFIDRAGNLIIGIKDYSELTKEHIILQAHLDHPGGILQYSKDNNYFFTPYYGHSGNVNLLGYKIGVFVPDNLNKELELEIDFVDNKINYPILYFAPENTKKEKLISLFKTKNSLIIHHPQNFQLDNNPNILKNWNLDNLLNNILLFYFLKTNKEFCKKNNIILLFTHNEEAGYNGIKYFLLKNQIHLNSFLHLM